MHFAKINQIKRHTVMYHVKVNTDSMDVSAIGRSETGEMFKMDKTMGFCRCVKVKLSVLFLSLAAYQQ